MSDVISRARKVQFERHAGMLPEQVSLLASEALANKVRASAKRLRKALAALLAAQDHHGMVVMLSRADIGASENTMMHLYYTGMVNGAGGRDHRGTGNTAESSFWWLTARGEQVARASGLTPEAKRAA